MFGTILASSGVMTRSFAPGIALGFFILIITPMAWAGHSGAARSIERSDLKSAIAATTLDTIRQNESSISPDAFHSKMRAALKSPLHLKQTFPGLLGVMVKPLVGTRALPGKVVPIGFDAHIENAGTVRSGRDSKGRSRSIETLIDFDDSGVGPAGVDAISIGTALAQDGFKHKVMKKVFKEFGKAATSSHAGPEEVDGPKWGKLRRKWVEKHTATEKRGGEKVLSFKGMDRATPDEYRVIEKAAKQNSVLRAYDVLDVAGHGKTGGGSGGLAEFMVLAKNKKTENVGVYFFKEQEAPGIDELGLRQPGDRTRLQVLENALWKEAPKDVFFYARNVKLPSDKPIDFLVRDKFAMVGDTATGKGKNETAVKVARLYGKEHAGQFGNMTASEIAHWMKKSTAAVTEGFDELHKKLKSEFKGWQPKEATE
ncbi:MAG: hypothetical protein ABI445_16005 [Polyangia bacterium]